MDSLVAMCALYREIRLLEVDIKEVSRVGSEFAFCSKSS